MCHMRRMTHTPCTDTCVSYEEEDTCVSYEEEDTCVSYEEDDTHTMYGHIPAETLDTSQKSYEEEDTRVSYEEEDTCRNVGHEPPHAAACPCRFPTPVMGLVDRVEGLA